MIDSTIESISSGQKIYDSGKFSELLDFTVPGASFHPIGTVNIGSFDPKQLTIFCYGHYHFENIEYVGLASVTAFATVNTAGGLAVFAGGYEMENGVIEFGIYNQLGGDVVPIAPYSTTEIFYTIFY